MTFLVGLIQGKGKFTYLSYFYVLIIFCSSKKENLVTQELVAITIKVTFNYEVTFIDIH